MGGGVIRRDAVVVLNLVDKSVESRVIAKIFVLT